MCNVIKLLCDVWCALDIGKMHEVGVRSISFLFFANVYKTIIDRKFWWGREIFLMFKGIALFLFQTLLSAILKIFGFKSHWLPFDYCSIPGEPIVISSYFLHRSKANVTHYIFVVRSFLYLYCSPICANQCASIYTHIPLSWP